MRTGQGGNVAVAASSALLSVCLAGGPLYISSTASEAVQVGLSRTCLADAGLTIVLLRQYDPATGELLNPSGVDVLDQLAADLPNTQRPIITDITGPIEFHAVDDTDISATRLIALYRQDQGAHLDGAPSELLDGKIIAPLWDADVFGVGTSDAIELTQEPVFVVQPDDGVIVEPTIGADSVLRLDVAGTYADIPTRPEPTFWCAQRDLFRLKPSGDRPLPVALVNEATIQQLDPTRIWELRPQADGLTRDQAKQLIHGFNEITARYVEMNGAQPGQLAGVSVPSQMPDLVRRAEVLTEVVARTIAPIRLGGIGVAMLLLVTSGVMVARERRRDLRLRVIRGVHPGRVAARVALSEAVPVVVGAVIGVVTAFVAVRALGPTPEFEPGPVRVALAAAAIGAMVATAVVGFVAAFATSRAVDPRPRTHHRSLPWELVLVPLAVISYLRLDQFGGVRLLGATAGGGDLAAQAFPILALAAPLAIITRPLIAFFRRTSRIATRARVPVLIGIRRVSFEPVASAVLCVTVAFAVGAFMVSGSLTASAEQLLIDKTNTYLGGDMVVRTRSLDAIPPALQDRATPIALVSANIGGHPVDIIGIDPDSFEGAVHWRADASESSLADLVDSIVDTSGDAAGSIKAIVIGDIDGGPIVTKSNEELLVTTVASPRWFPGLHSGAALVVVDVAALNARDLRAQSFIWLTDPPPDTERILRDHGTTVLNVRESADVFEVTSFLTVKWSYAVLAAFGVLVGIAALLAQLLVLDARRPARQTTWTLSRRMGMTLRSEAVAIVTELGVPLGLGTMGGLGLGWLAVVVSVNPLDTIRHLEPPARAIIDLSSVAAALLAGLVALAVLTIVGLIGVVRTKPMEVMRGGN